MPNYTIKFDMTSDDPTVLRAIAHGLIEMRNNLVISAENVANRPFGNGHTYKTIEAPNKLKSTATRLVALADLIEDINVQIEQLAEDRPDVVSS